MEPAAGSTSSTEAGGGSAERVAIGRVVGAHGTRGQIRVRYFGAAPDHLTKLETALLAASEDGSDAECFEVIRATAGRRDEVLMTLAGVADRQSAECLRGKLVVTEAARLEALPEGEYYSYQLIGCRVEAPDGQPIGAVREIWPTGGVDVLVVEGPDGARQLIPAADAQLRAVDLEARRIVIEIPPGLLDPA